MGTEAANLGKMPSPNSGEVLTLGRPFPLDQCVLTNGK